MVKVEPGNPIDWAGAGDCLDQLRLVRTAAQSGRLEKAHAPLFAVVLVTPTTSLDWVSAPTVPLVADVPRSPMRTRGCRPLRRPACSWWNSPAICARRTA